MSEPATEAGRKALEIFDKADMPQDAFSRKARLAIITSIEQEARADLAARIVAAVEGLEDYHGWTMRPPNAQRWLDRAAVLTAIREASDDQPRLP